MRAVTGDILTSVFKYEFYRELGLFAKWSHVNSIDNLIYLCGGCHKNFDEKVPEWIFLPENLSEFLDDEEKFQENRKSNRKSRRTPPKRMHRRYIRYQIHERDSSARAIKLTKAKDWLGNPIAAIVRSLACIASMRLNPDSQEGLPEDVAAMAHRLLFLYGTYNGIENLQSVEGSKGKPKTKQTPTVVTEKTWTIEELKDIEKNNKRPLLDDDEDGDGGTYDKASDDTSQTAFSYDTRLSRANRRKKIARLAFIMEEQASDTETERSPIPGPSVAEERRRRHGNAQARKWVDKQGEKRRNGLEGWLIMENDS